MPTLTLGVSNFSAAPNSDGWAALLGTARDADAAGIDRITVVDHVVMGSDTSAYDGARFPTGADGEWLEPLTVLSVIAGQTSRVRLSTGILIAALREPAVLAKTVATLDVLSGGRVDLGVGVGWQAKEYEAVGLDFARRGALLDATLADLRSLWGASPTMLNRAIRDAHRNTSATRVEDVWCEPKPTQPGGVPIWVSGRLNAAVLRRIVAFGDGWIPWGEYATDVAPSIPVVHEALQQAGRDPSGFQVRATLPIVRDSNAAVDLAATVRPVPELISHGATDFGVSLALPAIASERQDLLAALVDAFRTARLWA
ncbi:MAG: TIGR03619 family F420-dependent LLM class oxidoreductase [Acidimicrobiia bacterium]